MKPNSKSEIRRIAIKQANEGDVNAQAKLGREYYLEKDYKNALIWLRKAADKGNLTG